MRSSNACGTTDNSNVITVVTPALPAPPVPAAATVLTSCSFTANWAASVGTPAATGYFLDVSTDPAFGSFLTGFDNLSVGNVTSRSVTGLTPNTTYYYRVRSVNACGTTTSSAGMTVVVPDLPPAPVANATSAITCTGFTANWQAVAGATRYYWELSASPTFAPILQSNNLAGTSVAIAGLVADGSYYFRVWSRNGTACPNGDTLVMGPIATLTTPLKADADAATAIGCTALTANWQATATANNYRFDLSTSPTFASYVAGQNNVATGNVTSRTITGLTPGTTYYYRVRPVNACLTPAQNSPLNSDTITVVTVPLSGTPVVSAASPIGCTTFSAQWQAATDADGYYLDVSTSPAFGTFIAGYNNRNVGNVTSWDLTGLTLGATYYYRVRSYRAGTGCTSPNSTTQTVVLQNIPPTPATTVSTNIFTCRFNANWAALATATGYILDVATTSTFTAGTFVAGYQARDVGNVNTFVVEGLNPSTNYYTRVRAYNACGTSANSPFRLTTTAASFTLAPPTPLPATFVLSCRFNAEWTAIPGATTYRLDVSEDINFGSFVGVYENFDTGDNTTWPVAGLTPNTTYYYRLRGANPCGVSLFSDTITVNTGSLLSVPTTISVTGVACDQFTANWGAVPNVTDYRLDVSTSPTFGTMLMGYNNLNVGNVSSYVVSGLAQNTTYYFRVRAVNQCGATASSVVENMTTDFAEPPMPQPATDITCSQFVANWDAVSGATGYLIDVAEDASFATILGTYSNFSVGNVTSYTITGISPNNIYYYRVRSVKPCGTSASSATTTVDLTGGTPGLWTGNGNDNDWHNCVNWDDLIVPTSGDVVIPPPPSTTPLNVPTVTLNSLTMNNTLGIRMVGNVTLTSFLRLVLGLSLIHI